MPFLEQITMLVGKEYMTLIIIGLTMVMFILDKLPVSLTAMISALSLALFGCMEFHRVYDGFGTNVIMLVVGMMVVGDALFQTGAVVLVGRRLLESRVAKNERVLVIVMAMLVGLLSAFLSNTATMATFIPLVGAMVMASNGRLSNKNILMPLGMAASVGGTITLVGSTAQPMVNTILMEEGFPAIGMFDFAILAGPAFIALLIYLGTVGYGIEKKEFKFKDGEPAHKDKPVARTEASTAIEEEDEANAIKDFEPTKKTYVAFAIMGLCILAFAFEIMPSGIVGIIGGLAVILTRCVDFRKTMKRVDWNTVLLLGFGSGIASGMHDSGAGAMVARFAIDLVGDNPGVLFAVAVIITVIITNVMSNTAVAAMMTPIFILVSTSLGYSPYLFALGIAIGANIAIATPIGGTAMSQTLVAGYDFKDYIKLGLPITVIMLAIVIFIGTTFIGFQPL